MEREIKFRAWDKENKIMRFVWGLNFEFNCSDLKSIWCDKNAVDPVVKEEYIIKQPNFELMQYTGLLDKNGKEIYEGDVVCWREKCRGGGYMPDKNYSTVEWDSDTCRFRLLGLLKDYSIKEALSNHEEAEVIGNIYENPELLTSSEGGK